MAQFQISALAFIVPSIEMAPMSAPAISRSLYDEAATAAVAAAVAPPPAMKRPPVGDLAVQQSSPRNVTPKGTRSSTPAAEREKVLAQIEALMSSATVTKKEADESEEMNLPPARAMRMRRKSKDLELEAMAMFASFEHSLEQVFNEIDTDKSGFIEPAELHEAFAKLGRKKTQREIKLAVEKLDANGDGMISLDEFKNLSLLFAS